MLTEKVSFNLSIEQLDTVDKIAIQTKSTRAEIIRQAVEEFLAPGLIKIHREPKERGIACPQCGEKDTRVLETRESTEGLRRRRECHAHGHRHNTIEIPVIYLWKGFQDRKPKSLSLKHESI